LLTDNLRRERNDQRDRQRHRAVETIPLLTELKFGSSHDFPELASAPHQQRAGAA
jgi:hypothetical protein